MIQLHHTRIQDQIKVFRRIIIAILLMFLVMLLGSIFGFMADEVSGSGTVAGIREYELKALQPARVVKVFHHEGELVQAGEPLLAFDDRAQQDIIRKIQNRCRELALQIKVKEHELSLLHKDPLPEYYRHTTLQLQEARERLAKNTKELEVFQELFKQRAVTRRELLQVELGHLTSRMSVERLAEDAARLDGMAEQIISRAQAELDLLRQELSSCESELEDARAHLEDYILRAPDAGVPTDIPPRAGGFYQTGEPVIRFAANQSKKIIGMIHEKHIFKVEPGQPVRIRASQYNYLDYGYFSGKVDIVYQLPVAIDGANYYPVKILLDDEPQELRFGSSCEVSIITGRERVIFLLLGFRSEDYLKRRQFFRKFHTRKPSPGETGDAAAPAVPETPPSPPPETR
ncbi:MAG: HlyD family efflux transporter periplasmic adaptor subunit [Lentisphaeria bacterium]|nr:HlyD family efflux transporter periplasmic adaptor subunit [Lentisphaeria bacterium]